MSDMFVHSPLSGRVSGRCSVTEYSDCGGRFSVTGAGSHYCHTNAAASTAAPEDFHAAVAAETRAEGDRLRAVFDEHARARDKARSRLQERRGARRSLVQRLQTCREALREARRKCAKIRNEVPAETRRKGWDDLTPVERKVRDAMKVKLAPLELHTKAVEAAVYTAEQLLRDHDKREAGELYSATSGEKFPSLAEEVLKVQELSKIAEESYQMWRQFIGSLPYNRRKSIRTTSGGGGGGGNYHHYTGGVYQQNNHIHTPF